MIAESYIQILTNIAKYTFNDPTHYIQLILAILFVVIAKITARKIFSLTADAISHFHFKTSLRINILLERYLRPFISPLITMILLSIMAVILIKMGKNQTITLSCMELALIWLLIRVIKSFTNSSFFGTVVAIILIPIAILNIFDLLDPTIAYLDKFDFSIGNFRISAYLLFRGIIYLIFISWFTFLISKSIKNHIRRQFFINTNTKELLTKIVDLVLYMMVFLIGLSLFGFDLSSLIVFSGALTIVFGFGAQKIFANFMSGLILLCERSILVGDVIELEPNKFCHVRHLGGRYVRVETFDGKEIMIPNENLITMNVTNLTHTNNAVRIDIPLRLPYNIDYEKLKNKIEETLKNHETCAEDPEPLFMLTGYNDSFMGALILFWINDISDGIFLSRHKIIMALNQIFLEEKIEIPYQKIGYPD